MNWSSLYKAQAAIALTGLTGIVAVATQLFIGAGNFLVVAFLVVGLGGVAGEDVGEVSEAVAARVVVAEARAGQPVALEAP